MKRTLYSLTLILALLATALPSRAQKNNNWFLGVGIGCNMLYDNAKLAPAAPAAQLYVGDWFTPSFGFRASLHGILSHPADPGETWFSSDTVFGLFQLHADGLWNFMNTFTSYKYNRVWNPALYARVSGFLASSLGTHKGHVGIGGGWINQFRVTDFMSIALDLNAIVTNEKVFRTDHTGRFVVLGSATVGVVFDLGFRGF
jgi:hypothetical protein